MLLGPLATILVGTMGVITTLNSRNAEAYAQKAAIELVERTSHEVSLYLTGFMRQPVQVVENMADAMDSGMVEAENEKQTLNYLLQLRAIFPDVPYISYAFTNHAFIGVGKGSNNDKLPDILEIRPPGETRYLYQYSLRNNGSMGPLQNRDHFNSFLQEDWFAAPLRSGGLTWSKIYNWDDAPDVLAISLGKPILKQGKAIGIAGSDVLLVTINRYLQSLRLSPRSVITITEDSGQLVGTSEKELPYDIRNGKGERRAALMDPNPVIRGSAATLMRRYNGFDNIPGPRTLLVPLERESYLIRTVPWRDPHGLHWIITLAVPESDFTGFVSKQRRDTLLLSLAAISVAGLLGWRLVSLLLRPIEEVATASTQLAEEGRAPSLRPGPLAEANRLSDAFGAMASTLLTVLRKLEERKASAEQEVSQRTRELQQAHHRLEEEGKMAARIQQDLLIPGDRLKELSEEFDIGALMEASRSVGGDLYDVIAVRDDFLLFCVGDVSGKGMPAALLMSTCLSLLRAYAEALDSPSAIMRRINQRLSAKNDDCAFTTLVIGVMHRSSGEMRFCNAGHNPMLLLRTGGHLEVLRVVHGPALGIQADVVYREDRLSLEPEDFLFAYSDGATEMFNRSGQRFGLKRLQRSLLGWRTEVSDLPSRGNAQQLVQALQDDLLRFAAGEPPHDDITLLALRRLCKAIPDGEVG